MARVSAVWRGAPLTTSCTPSRSVSGVGHRVAVRVAGLLSKGARDRAGAAGDSEVVLIDVELVPGSMTSASVGAVAVESASGETPHPKSWPAAPRSATGLHRSLEAVPRLRGELRAPARPSGRAC